MKQNSQSGKLRKSSAYHTSVIAGCFIDLPVYKYTFVTLVAGFHYSCTTVRRQANTIKTKQLKHAGDFHLKATHTTLDC